MIHRHMALKTPQICAMGRALDGPFSRAPMLTVLSPPSNAFSGGGGGGRVRQNHPPEVPASAS